MAPTVDDTVVITIRSVDDFASQRRKTGTWSTMSEAKAHGSTLFRWILKRSGIKDTTMSTGMSDNSPQGDTFTQSEPKSRKKTALFLTIQLISVAWLAPAIFLLYVNFKGQYIGSTIACYFKRNCHANPLSDRIVAINEKADEQNHDILGALQIVAKVLEIWFMFVATGLVYEVAMLLARQRSGIPIGLMTSHVEFGDLLSLCNRGFWSFPRQSQVDVKGKGDSTAKLYVFVVFVAAMSIIANLIGPAMAVLLIPQLQWTTFDTDTQIFNKLNSASSPAVNSVLRNCSVAMLEAHNYTCTSNEYSTVLDGWAALALSSSWQTSVNQLGALPPLAQEKNLAFTVNLTSQPIAWVPNRLVLQHLSDDYYEFFNVVSNGDTSQPYSSFNDSLQVVMQRAGPSIGMDGWCYLGTVDSIIEEADKEVRCYSGWQSDAIAIWDSPYTYTKCIRTGSGWNDTLAHSNFSIAGTGDSEPLSVNIHVVGRAAYVSPDTLKCATTKSCDWDKIFSDPVPPAAQNMSTNQHVYEFRVSDIPHEEAIWCDNTFYPSTQDHVINPSYFDNPFSLISLDMLSQSKENIVVHPHWYLAAWSAAEGGIVNGTRPAAADFVNLYKATFDNDLWIELGIPGIFDAFTLFSLLQSFVAGQAVSMVDYTVNETSTRNPKTTDEVNHPILLSKTTLQGWSFGITSRTSLMGIMVVTVACVCVLLRLIMGLITRSASWSLTEILAAALKHQHEGELHGLDSELKIGKARFRMRDQEDDLKFIPTAVDGVLEPGSVPSSDSGFNHNIKRHPYEADGI
jgi:hypothetical protein